jgi:hypothetical protein
VGPDYGWAWDVDVCQQRSEEECSELIGSDNYCSVCGPCPEGLGDCDGHDDCEAGLICANNVGDEYGWDPTIDVCEVGSEEDCAELIGDWDYCVICGPCEDGEGDCDSISECAVGLTCVDDVGEEYGWDAATDVCEPNPECPDLLGDVDYCSVCGPCEEGQGDCDGNQECKAGLVCVNNIGADFGLPWEFDVCLASGPADCPVPPGHYDYCSLCGPCTKGAGDCDSDADCVSGLSCSTDVGVFYDWPFDVDVCEEPGD